MQRRIRITRTKRFLAVAMMLGALLAASSAPVANAGKRTTDPLYNFSLDGGPAPEPANGITSDGLGTYSEPTDASGPYWAFSPLAARSFTLNLAGIADVTGAPAVNYACVAGSSLYTDTNPFVYCYGDKEQTRGFILDYPPYGNATKQTMKLACAVVTKTDTSYVSEVPATDCKAHVWQVNAAKDAPSWYLDAPFRFESRLQS